MELQLLKGTKDSTFEEQMIKERITDTLKKYFKIYGYSPLETPILELFEILASKYAGGAEILKETYKLVDQGGREVALRYDLTIPYARYIGMNPQLQFPIKRYEIGKSFRDGPVKLGRLREFTQCDCDVIGIKGMTADAELLMMALQAFKELQFDAYLEVNNRKLLSGILDAAEISPELQGEIILSIDKVKKIGEIGVRKELSEKGITVHQADKVFSLFNECDALVSKYFEDETKLNNISELFQEINSLANNELIAEGTKELNDLFTNLKNFGLSTKNIKKKILLNLSLARGLEIYTSTVFEGFLKNSKVKSSICGGGRWDNAIGSFLQNNQKYPAVGISFGLDALYAGIKNQENSNEETIEKQVATDVFVIPIKCLEESLSTIAQLREAGIHTDFDQMNRNIGKNMNFANKKGIPYVLIIGKKELDEGKLTLHDMISGEEYKLTIKEIITKITQ